MHRRSFLCSALALSAVTIGGAVQAQDQTPVRRWRNFGADRSYRSMAEAKAAVPDVLRRAGWSEEAVLAMAEEVRTNPNGEAYVINVGDRLDFMRSGASELWRNVLVDFERPEPNMQYAADATRWIVRVRGEVMELIIPHICFNIAGRRSGIVEARLECAYVVFEAREDDAYAIVHILGPDQPEGECQISVLGPASPTPNFDGTPRRPLADEVENRCPTDWIPQAFGLPGLRVGSFRVTRGFWAIKLPVVMADNPGNRVVICLVKQDGRSTRSLGVQFFEYKLQRSGRKVATIWYSEEELRQRRPDYLTGPNPTILWWRWTNSREVCRIQAYRRGS